MPSPKQLRQTFTRGFIRVLVQLVARERERHVLQRQRAISLAARPDRDAEMHGGGAAPRRVAGNYFLSEKNSPIVPVVLRAREGRVFRHPFTVSPRHDFYERATKASARPSGREKVAS